MRDENSNRPLHTIAEVAARGLERTKKGLALSAEAAEELRHRLVLARDTPELAWAVRSLLLVAARLEERNGKLAANAIIELASTATPSLIRLASENRSRPRGAMFGARPQKLISNPRVATVNRVIADRLNLMPRRA